MRHACAGRQFGRNSGHRKALLKMLVTALLRNEKIETTVAKAKEIGWANAVKASPQYGEALKKVLAK